MLNEEIHVSMYFLIQCCLVQTCVIFLTMRDEKYWKNNEKKSYSGLKHFWKRKTPELPYLSWLIEYFNW